MSKLVVGHYARHENPVSATGFSSLRPRNETAIQRAILDYLNVRSIFAWRTNNIAVKGRSFHGLKGVPDIVGILPGGRFLGIECKSATGKQSAEQSDFQAKCTKLGGTYILARSIDDVIAALAPKPLVKIRRD